MLDKILCWVYNEMVRMVLMILSLKVERRLCPMEDLWMNK